MVIEVKSSMEAIKADIATLKANSSTKDESVNNAEIYSEIRERKNRELNVLVHHLKEPSGSTRDGRMKEDKEAFVNLCSKINVDLNPSKVKFMTRLGRYDKDGSRPLLVGLKEATIKGDILDNAHMLVGKPDPWSKININPDLTKQQRKEEQELYNKAEQLNNNLSETDKKTSCTRWWGGRREEVGQGCTLSDQSFHKSGFQGRREGERRPREAEGGHRGYDIEKSI